MDIMGNEIIKQVAAMPVSSPEHRETLDMAIEQIQRLQRHCTELEAQHENFMKMANHADSVMREAISELESKFHSTSIRPWL